MESLHNDLTLHIPQGCFPLSTDSILLADFVRLPKQAAVLDLGSGCGTLGLLLCARDGSCTVTGVELDETAHAAALDNIRRNGLESRFHSICADLRSVPTGNYDVCLSNPPYYTGGPASTQTPTARRDDNCTMMQLFAAASKSLKFGGDFFLVHKPERLAALCAAATDHNLEPKRLRLIRHRTDGPVSLILLACRKGAKAGLLWEEYALHHPDGSPTDYYNQLYHIQEVSHGRNALSRPHTHR